MEKLRVYELAKKVGVDSKLVMKVLGQLKIEVKNHMSTLEPATVQTLLDIFAGKVKVQEAGERREGELTRETESRLNNGNGAAARAAGTDRAAVRMASDRLAVRVGGPVNRPAPEPVRPNVVNRDRLATRQAVEPRVATSRPGAAQGSALKPEQKVVAREAVTKTVAAGQGIKPSPGAALKKDVARADAGKTELAKARERQVVKTGLWTPEMDQARSAARPRAEGAPAVKVVAGRPATARPEVPGVQPEVPRESERSDLTHARVNPPEEIQARRSEEVIPAAGEKVEKAPAALSPAAEGQKAVAEPAQPEKVEKVAAPEAAKPAAAPKVVAAPPVDMEAVPREAKEKEEVRREPAGRPTAEEPKEEVRPGRDRLKVIRPEETARKPVGKAAGPAPAGPIPKRPEGEAGLPIRRPTPARPGAEGRPLPPVVRGPVSGPRGPEGAVPAEKPPAKPTAQPKKAVKRLPERERARDWVRDEEEERLLAKVRPIPKGKTKPKPAVRPEEKPATPRVIALEGPISVKDLAEKMAIKGTELLKKLISLGIMATINQEIDLETAAVVAEEFGVQIEEKPQVIEEPEDEVIVDDPADLVPRAPVVTVMGHVDHGKTSLLDAIRKTNVTAEEAGGITQHIGASTVEVGDRKVVFLDTPGHEAFTAMRARGAKATDIAVLVVAADDGVMPQTVEAINHARAAGVPIVVAINKIDKPNAQPERVKQQLTEYGLVPEEWGGTTIMVPVSARDKRGIDQLLEMILLVADMEELKANPKRPARGIVIEAQLDKGRGPVGTVLIQNGTLSVGDAFVSGRTYGKVRAMTDDRGRRLKKAGPATPVEVIGFTDVPSAGDIFIVVEDERKAKEVAARRQVKRREEELRVASRLTLDDLYRRMKEGELKELNLIIKGDVQGTVEAVRQSLEKLGNEEIKVRVIHAGVGAITETDVMLASASGAIIIGFDVRPDPKAREAAEREKVDVRTYRVIYDAIDDVKAALKGMLTPKFKETLLGRAEVRATFKVPKVGTVAGCYVLEGKITRNAQVRVIRDGVVIHEGKIESLKHFKDDVREITAGKECGIGLERFQDIKEGDIIEGFIMEQVKEEA